MAEKNPHFCRSGELSRSGLRCGYVETYTRGGVHLSLWREYDTYHVRAHDHDEGKRLCWDSYGTLGPARRAYRKARAAIKRGVVPTCKR